MSWTDKDGVNHPDNSDPWNIYTQSHIAYCRECNPFALAPPVAQIPKDAVPVWGTDYWGTIMSEPSESMARHIVKIQNVRLYRKSPGCKWELVETT